MHEAFRENFVFLYQAQRIPAITLEGGARLFDSWSLTPAFKGVASVLCA